MSATLRTNQTQELNCLSVGSLFPMDFVCVCVYKCGLNLRWLAAFLSLVSLCCFIHHHMISTELMEKAAHSCSSSIDSSNHPPSPSSAASSLCLPNSNTRRDLSTDLRLGLSITPSYNDVSSTSTQRQRRLDWPPIKSLLRSTLAGKTDNRHRDSLFVKVYMEGIPIGRKLDLFAHESYSGLITTLGHMFRTTILCPDGDRVHSNKHHVLTYEDKEGDWMMVGDVPWEMFLTTVKRLKITRADRC